MIVAKQLLCTHKGYPLSDLHKALVNVNSQDDNSKLTALTAFILGIAQVHDKGKVSI